MIGFKTRGDQIASVLILVSLVVITATMIFELLAPKVAVTGKYALTGRMITRDTDDAQQAAARTAKYVTPRLWTGKSDEISASILSLLAETARNHHVKLGAFRPQKPRELDGTVELPYVVEVSGSYPDIAGVLASLDNPHTKLALRAVDLAAGQSKSRDIVANLGLSAYAPTNPVLAAAAAPKASHAKPTSGKAGRKAAPRKQAADVTANVKPAAHGTPSAPANAPGSPASAAKAPAITIHEVPAVPAPAAKGAGHA